jgi:hypothetical protein
VSATCLAELGEARAALPSRINTDAKTVERDLAKVVLSLIDLVRRLMERQAARRVNAGSLTDDEIERLGETFLALEGQMEKMANAFGLEAEDLEMNLGPIGDLL